MGNEGENEVEAWLFGKPPSSALVGISLRVFLDEMKDLMEEVTGMKVLIILELLDENRVSSELGDS